MKLIASDFDGTVGRGEQLQKDVEAIRRFRAAGNLFGLVSGRNIAGLRYVQHRAEIPVDFLLSDSGGTCYVDGRMLFCAQSCSEVFFPLCSFLMARNTRLLAVNRPDGSDMLYYRHRDGREEYNPKRALWQERTFPQMSGLFGDYAECREKAEELERLFPRLTALPNDDCLDIVPKGRNKAVGIAELAEHFGVKKEEIFTVGDNYNDLAMLDAYQSFVVASAPDEVKQHAACGVVVGISDMIDFLMR